MSRDLWQLHWHTSCIGGWTTDSLARWTRYETAFMTEAHINLMDDWWVIEATLFREAAQQRTSRFAAKKNCQSVVSGLDWEVSRQAQRKLTAVQANHTKTWNQAAIHYKQGDKPKTCPLCQVPATPKHIIWLCKWHHKQGHEALPIPWTERLQRPFGRTTLHGCWHGREGQRANPFTQKRSFRRKKHPYMHTCVHADYIAIDTGVAT